MNVIGLQAITWANVDPDPCRHMVSLGHNELINILRPRQNDRNFADDIFNLFSQKKLFDFDSKFTEIHSQELNQQ